MDTTSVLPSNHTVLLAYGNWNHPRKRIMGNVVPSVTKLMEHISVTPFPDRPVKSSHLVIIYCITDFNSLCGTYCQLLLLNLFTVVFPTRNLTQESIDLVCLGAHFISSAYNGEWRMVLKECSLPP